jgi:hypothetical protein
MLEVMVRLAALPSKRDSANVSFFRYQPGTEAGYISTQTPTIFEEKGVNASGILTIRYVGTRDTSQCYFISVQGGSSEIHVSEGYTLYFCGNQLCQYYVSASSGPVEA